MPTINGRFYANPAFGRALERARLWESQRENASEHRSTKHRRYTVGHDAATTIDGVANQIYNETSGLRPTALRGPGSDLDLQYARMYMGHVIHNRVARKIPGGLAYDKLTGNEPHAIKHLFSAAYDSYGGSHHAAKLSFSHPDPTGGATGFYLDHGQRLPPWAKGKKTVATFGPFTNAAGKGDVPKGEKVRIVIIP